MRRPLTYALAVILATLLVACSDEIVSPTARGAAPQMESSPTGLHLGEVPMQCAIYRTEARGGHGYAVWVKHATFFYPRSEVPVSGATRTYRYRGYSAGPTLVVYADCEIPASDAAVRLTDRFFRVKRTVPAGAEDLISTQECTRIRPDGTCELETLPVIGCATGGEYPNCNATDPGDYATCEMLGTCGGGGWWDGGDGSGGTGGGWTESPSDGSEQPPCERDANGACKVRPPSQTPPPGKPRSEWEQIGALIDGMKEDTEWCRYAKQALLALYNQGYDGGRFKVWDGYNQLPDGRYAHGQTLSDAYGPVIAVSSYWLWNDSYLLVHEGLHMYWNANAPTTGTIGANDPWIYEHQYDCL